MQKHFVTHNATEILIVYYLLLLLLFNTSWYYYPLLFPGHLLQDDEQNIIS